VAATALRFVLSHPAVTCLIPGRRSVRNVERNAAVSDAGPLDAETLAVLRRHRWVRNVYQD
jgi:aryl-alcohol dehydrogenase-like predicted oxidoreductase